MARAISNVPKEHVGVVVQDFVDNGEQFILAQMEPAGTYTVSPQAPGPEPFDPAVHLSAVNPGHSAAGTKRRGGARK